MAIERHKADELIRQQQQGLGKSIISCKFKDKQLVAVGNTVYCSENWKTFPASAVNDRQGTENND